MEGNKSAEIKRSRTKRRLQKKRKRHLRILHGMLGQSSIGDISMPVTPETGNTQVSHSENDVAVSLPTAVASALDQSGKEPTMVTGDASPRNVNLVADAAQNQVGVDYYYDDIEDFWKALDKKSDEFWERYEKQLDEVKKCADFDTAIIEGPNNFTVTIQSDLTYSPLERINYHEYVRRIKEKQDKLCKTIQLLRDRCESLELDIVQAKEEAKQAQCQAKVETDRIRKFWRNKIYEGGSRSGRLVRAAMQNF